jgi:hypothetical protein
MIELLLGRLRVVSQFGLTSNRNRDLALDRDRLQSIMEYDQE